MIPKANTSKKTHSTHQDIIHEKAFFHRSRINEHFITIGLILFFSMIGTLFSHSYIVSSLAICSISWSISIKYVRYNPYTSYSTLLAFAFIIPTSIVAALTPQFINNFLYHYYDNEIDIRLMVGLFGIFGAVAARYYWRIYQVPNAIAIGVAILSGSFIYIVDQDMTIQNYANAELLNWIKILIGFAVIHYIITQLERFNDDKNRVGKKIAFWLYPIVIFYVLNPAYKVVELINPNSIQTIVIVGLGLTIAFAAIALALNRKSLFIEAFFYYFWVVLQHLNLFQEPFYIAAFPIGLILVLHFWLPLRPFFLRLLPSEITKYV